MSLWQKMMLHGSLKEGITVIYCELMIGLQWSQISCNITSLTSVMTKVSPSILIIQII